jgi:nucleoside-diphosphate-sugar epimerase
MSRFNNDNLSPRTVKDNYLAPLQTFKNTAIGTTAAALLSLFVSEKESRAATTGPVVVIGSGGKTGKLIVESLSKRGVSVRPSSRSEGTDVTKIETLAAAIEGASSVIFAASASRKGGSAQQVDFLGVQNVAKECVRLKIPRLVVISSGAITRPKSLGFKITNLFGNIMEYKLKGENSLKESYAEDGKGLSYVIIRPGGLLDGNIKGPSGLSLNQGDAISGEISRADVAECAVAAALSTKLPREGGVTFEIYNTDGSGPLEGGLPAITGYERVGADYDVLFEGLKAGEVSIS